MDHFESLAQFCYGDAPLRPIRWLGYDHANRPPCSFKDYLLKRGLCQADLEALKSKKVDSDFVRNYLPMLQSWLFIGALEFIAGRRIPGRDFLRTRLNKPVVSTRFIAPLLDTWEKSTQDLPLPQREVWNDDVREILSEIQFWCFKLASSDIALNDSNGTQSPPTELDATCRLLTLTGEAINTARTYLHTPTLPNTKGFSGAYTPLEERRIVSRLVKVGWCPFMARILNTFRYSVAEYASFWNKTEPKFGRSHNQCSPERCVAYDVDTSIYQPRHETPGCACPYVAPPIQEIKKRLHTGSIPIITLRDQSSTDQGQIQLDVLDAADSKSRQGYAAISHVWSDGIGSNSERGLPSCVVESLFARAQAYGRSCIWIDSLCVPAEPDVRGKAIQLMAKTYRDAAITLVLDSQIRRIHFGLSSASIERLLLMLVTSPWMQRLWTLQEAVLSESLVFQFQNTMATAADIYIGLHGNFQTRLNPVTQVLGNEFHRLLQSSSVKAAVPEEQRTLELGHVYRMLRIRSTSKARDEAIVIAGLLNVDVGSMLKTNDPEARMRILYKTLKKVPSDIIFGSKQRMEGQGFLWAPTSFLMNETTSSDRWSLTTSPSAQWAEVLDEGGLRGKYIVTQISDTVCLEYGDAVTIRFGDKLVKVTKSTFRSRENSDSIKFDSFAMLPHLGGYESMKLAAALLHHEKGTKGDVYEYRGRLLVGDLEVYKSPEEENKDAIDAWIHGAGDYREIMIV